MNHDFRAYTRNSSSPDSPYNNYYMPVVEEISPPMSPKPNEDEDGSSIPHGILSNPQYQGYIRQIKNLQLQYDLTKTKQLQIIQRLNEYDNNDILLDTNSGFGFAKKIYLQNKENFLNTHMPYIPLYNQPSDVFNTSKTLQETIFQVRLRQHIKIVKTKRYQRNQALVKDYENKSIAWKEKLEAFEKERMLEFNKLQTVFFKTFPILPKKLKEKEESVIGSCIVPPILFDTDQRKYPFINTNNKLNGIVEEHAIWTNSERDTFLKCYQTYGKKFVKYVPSLPRKNIHKIIEYYYLTKHKDEFKTSERVKKKMVAEGSSKKLNAKKASVENVSKIKMPSHVTDNILNSSFSGIQSVNKNDSKKKRNNHLNKSKKLLQECGISDQEILVDGDKVVIDTDPLKEHLVCEHTKFIPEWNSEIAEIRNITAIDDINEISEVSTEGISTSVLADKIKDTTDGRKIMLGEEGLNKEISVIMSSGVNQVYSSSEPYPIPGEIVPLAYTNLREGCDYMERRRDVSNDGLFTMKNKVTSPTKVQLWSRNNEILEESSHGIGPKFLQDLNTAGSGQFPQPYRGMREGRGREGQNETINQGMCGINKAEFGYNVNSGETTRKKCFMFKVDSSREISSRSGIYTPNSGYFPRGVLKPETDYMVRESRSCTIIQADSTTAAYPGSSFNTATDITHRGNKRVAVEFTQFQIDSSREMPPRNEKYISDRDVAGWSYKNQGNESSIMGRERGESASGICTLNHAYSPTKFHPVREITDNKRGEDISAIFTEDMCTPNQNNFSHGIPTTPIPRGKISLRDVRGNIGALNKSTRGICPMFQAGYSRGISHDTGNIIDEADQKTMILREERLNEETSIFSPRGVCTTVQGNSPNKNLPVTKRLESRPLCRSGMFDPGSLPDGPNFHEDSTNSFYRGICTANPRNYQRVRNPAMNMPGNTCGNPNRYDLVFNEDSVIKNVSKSVISAAKRHPMFEQQKYIFDNTSEIRSAECIDLTVNSSRKSETICGNMKRGDVNVHGRADEEHCEPSTSGIRGSASIGKDFIDNAIGIFFLTDQIKTEAISSVLKLNEGEPAPENRNGLSLLSDVAASVEPYNTQQE